MWYFSGERLNSSLSLYLKVVIEISSLRMDWGSLFQRVAPLQLNRLLPYFRSRVVGMSSLNKYANTTLNVLRYDIFWCIMISTL